MSSSSDHKLSPFCFSFSAVRGRLSSGMAKEHAWAALTMLLALAVAWQSSVGWYKWLYLDSLSILSAGSSFLS